METSGQAPEQAPAAKQTEEVLGHTAALLELSKEVPADQRSPQDEQYMQELLQEGHQLRAQAREAQGAHKPVVTASGEVQTPHDREAELQARETQGHAYQR